MYMVIVSFFSRKQSLTAAYFAFCCFCGWLLCYLVCMLDNICPLVEDLVLVKSTDH